MTLKTEHQQRIEKMMNGFEQTVPEAPKMPDAKTRLLRARLILEEALETVNALGFTISTELSTHVHWVHKVDDMVLHPTLHPNLVEIADGCADISVVTIGTLSACGIAAKPLLEEVDDNNLRKVEKGHWDDYGKFVKPEGHRPPNVKALLKEQGWKTR